MLIILNNFGWMTFNLFLASISIFLALTFVRTQNILLKVIAFAAWLLFVPNTIYILTDLIHLERQIPRMEGNEWILLILQYALFEVIGVLVFLLAVYPMEKSIFGRLKSFKRHSAYFIVGLNFLIAFGVTMGRFQRTHSWYVVSDLPRVVNDVLQVFDSPLMLLFMLFFGITTNLIYFMFRRVAGKAYADASRSRKKSYR